MSEINNAFIKYWISYAETNLGWSKLQIAEIAFTLRVPTEFNRRSTTFDDEVKFRLAPGGGGGGSPTPDPDDCSCSYDASCFLDNISAECNDNADCDQTMIGCGFLWLYPCVGLCEVTQ